MNNKRKREKITKTWRLNKILLNKHRIKDESKKKVENILRQTKNITYQKLWDAVKAVLRRKFIAMNTYIKKEKINLK